MKSESRHPVLLPLLAVAGLVLGGWLLFSDALTAPRDWIGERNRPLALLVIMPAVATLVVCLIVGLASILDEGWKGWKVLGKLLLPWALIVFIGVAFYGFTALDGPTPNP